MRELIAKLEAATEGSRELDAEIYWAVDNAAAQRAYWNAALGLPRKLTGLMPSGLGRIGVECSAPHYTASLDAALTLLPAGYGAVSASINESGKSSVRIGHPYVFGEGATPALALTIAALKARTDDKETSNG